jgi:Phosphopantetheine attachment site
MPDDHLDLEITRVFAEVLTLKHVNPTDDFFELGGDSVLAAQLVRRLSRLLAAPIPLWLLVENPTAAGMAQHLRAEGAAARPDAAPPEP